MNDSVARLHSAVTLEMAQTLVQSGDKVHLGKSEDFAFDQRYLLVVRDQFSLEPNFVVSLEEGLPMKKMRLSEIVDFMVKCGVAGTKITVPLKEDIEFNK